MARPRLSNAMGSRRLPSKASTLLPLFQLLLWTSPLGANPESGVSFFGDGYLEMPLANAYNTVQLHLQFYTSQRSGLLFLAAGQTDYLLLELHAGVLEARMDLGSEEVTIKSPAGPHLNDLVIHDADLLVADGQMTLIVDNLFNASIEIPGHPQELDLDYGLYVGGTGTLELPYLTGVSVPFRGCLHTVTFNDQDVLSTLASGTKRSHGIREGCSVEFSAGADDPLGFLGPNSYIAFPGWSARNEGSIEFVITTSVKRAPLIYQSGLENDFFYLEIFDGRLRGVVEKGNGLVVLHNNIYLSNEQDHYVKVHVDVRKFEILVDYYASQTSNKGIHSYLDLQGPLFIGGLNEKAAERMRVRGLAFMSGNSVFNSSFVGCMEDLRINQERRSLQDALITRDVTAGCGKQEQYPDYDAVYEQDEAPTTSPPDHWQDPVMERCHPDPSLPPVFANFTKLLHVSPLVVAEGGTAFLEWRHTQPTIDLSSANIRQSQVLFSVTTDPRHGELRLDISHARNRRKFTLLDVVNRKVKYVHDGSEGPMDQLLLEVTVTARGGIPECLWQGQTYLLPIKINPVNDAPEVIFPHGDRMVILEHTRKHLNPEIIQAIDDDTPCDSLRFQLLGGKRMEEGYVEYDFRPGDPIEDFSCRELEAGHVVYVHQNGPTSTLIVQVNDGMVMSPVATLRVVAVEPDIQVRNNTGLFVTQGGIVPITTANLSVETNAVQQKVPILYRLTVPLQYGEIQKQGSLGGEWKKIESFHQQDVEQGRIQYSSTDNEHRTEDMVEKLQFLVQVGQKTLQNNTFLIRIEKATIQMKTLVPLQMKNEKEKNITTAEMEAVLETLISSSEPFHYVILQPPKKGNLELRGTRLTDGFGFTQEDLQIHQLSYSVTIRDSRESEDYFQFRVMAGAHFSPVYTYRIQIGGDPEAPILVNVLLSVLEGGQAVISKDHLFIKSANSANYLYEVIDGPTHGKLILRTSSPSSGEVITKFTNEDILQGHLVYQHDNSETVEDDLPFVAVKQDEGSSNMDAEDVRGVFRVSIQPVNDHSPVQVVNKVFNVVRNGQRLMTTDDIAFVDEDSGFSDTQLVFVRKDILFGGIIAVDDKSRQVYRFTQDDLRKKKILFVHSGADRGWIQFQVSDGLHQVATLLEVQASDPYIRINNHTGLVIRQGSQGTIDSSILSLETNMDIRNDEDILFRVIAPPRWGMVLQGGQEVSFFTQKDLLAGEVLYHHNGSRNSQDTIHLSIEANQVAVEDLLKVTIFLDSHPNSLNVVHHEKMHILQGEAVEIKRDHLLVEHEDIPPHEIIYTITVPPLSGFLVGLSHGHTSEEPTSLDPIETFTQEDINEGKVLYLHSSPEIQSDRFTVDITANGADPLEGLVMDLEILPISVPLEVHNFTVTEGSTQLLSLDILNIPSTYFTTLNVEFIVLEEPEYGIFQNVERPKEDGLTVFSWYEVEHQLIRYVHDGSESFADKFTVVANVSEVNQQSQPKSVFITVTPTNDEAPVLVVNIGLQIQEGASAEITPELLRSEDEDTPPEEVVYSIRTPVNGKVVLKPSPTTLVQRFTQAQINSGLVQFIHEGPLDGGFSFDLSDGENMSPGHFFAVTAEKKLLIRLENKQDLVICPGTSQPVRSQNLKAVTNDEGDASSLFYVIDQPPQFGRLLNIQKDNDGEELRNFTQSEVDAGVIYYEHEMPLEPFWSLEDAIHFRISAPPMTTDPYILRIVLSFEARCPQGFTKMWRNKGLIVPEAQSGVIDSSLLDASNLLALTEPDSKRGLYDVVFLVTELPAYGTLSVPDGPVDRRHPYFLQSDLSAGDLEYAHHGHGVLHDNFQFSAWLRHVSVKSIQPPQKEEGPIISGIFNITVKDSNEIAPRLVDQERVLRMLHGSSVVLSPEHLNIVDPDSPPEEIKYDILSGSSSGFVANIRDRQLPITQFTQADINAGHVMFISNGTSSSGVLDLAISDGHNPPIFTSLEIVVLPAVKWATNQTVLEIPQEVNVATLSHEHLLGSLDQGEQNTLYRLIDGPQFGQVTVSGKPVTEFSQKQVDNGEVTFSFTDFVSSEDKFQFLSVSGEANVSGVVSVAAKALVKTQQDGPWPRGATIQLDTHMLDARELANKTKSDPEFRLLQAPQRSQFVKVSRDKQSQPVPIDAFTQRDLERGLVGLEIWETDDSEGNLQQDSFLFELAAEGVPPALHSMKYITEAFNSSASYEATLLSEPSLQERDSSSTPQGITPSSQTLTLTTRPIELGSPGHNSTDLLILPTGRLGQGMTTSAPPAENGSLLRFIEANMFSIILPICLILLLLALILPLLFYLHKRNKTGKHNVQGTPPKYKNGTVVDQETFRKTDPNQGLPLSPVNSLEAKEAGLNSKGVGPGGQQDPELLQYCRTSNPALKNSQYWV